MVRVTLEDEVREHLFNVGTAPAGRVPATVDEEAPLIVNRAQPCDCCVASGTGGPGCGQQACAAAVCAIDAGCCDTEWDEACAGLDPPGEQGVHGRRTHPGHRIHLFQGGKCDVVWGTRNRIGAVAMGHQVLGRPGMHVNGLQGLDVRRWGMQQVQDGLRLAQR